LIPLKESSIKVWDIYKYTNINIDHADSDHYTHKYVCFDSDYRGGYRPYEN